MMEKTDFAELARHLIERERDLRLLMGHDMRRFKHGEVFVLAALQEQGAATTPTELASRFRLTRARITNILNSLEERGLVERTRSDLDRRVVEVAITDRGAEELKRAFEGHVDLVAGFLADLGERDARDLMRVMDHAVEVANRRLDVCKGGDR